VSNSATHENRLDWTWVDGPADGHEPAESGAQVDSVEPHGVASSGIGSGGCESGEDAARGSGRAEILLTMVSDPPALEEVLWATKGGTTDACGLRAGSITLIRAPSLQRWCGKLRPRARSGGCGFWMRR